MADFILKPVGQEAADALTAIHEECFPTYWDNSTFTDFFSVPATYAWVAYLEEPVGMAVYRTAFEQADILTIAVRPKWQRRGIAKQLLLTMMADAKLRGVQSLFLDVEDGNQPAIALYEAHGFAYLMRRKLYYRQQNGTYTDALVMKKELL